MGIVGSLVGVAFVVRALTTHWQATRDAVAQADADWLILGFVLALAGMTAMALPWRSAQRLVGPTLSRFDTVTLYFHGELGKYVPGAIWAGVGRAELARSRGVPRPAAYAGVVLSLVGLYLACAMVAAVSLLLGAGEGGSVGTAGWLLVVLPMGVVALHPRVVRPLLARLARSAGEPIPAPSWADASRLILQYLPAWLTVGLATMSVARAVTADLDLPQLLLATTLSWLAGFLAVGAPGGIGVREAVFVAVASALCAGAALAVAVLGRAAFIAADAMGSGISHLARWSDRRLAGR